VENNCSVNVLYHKVDTVLFSITLYVMSEAVIMAGVSSYSTQGHRLVSSNNHKTIAARETKRHRVRT